MRRTKISLMLSLVVLGLSGAAHAAPDPVVQLADGKLEGNGEGDVESFKGVPFAAPPVGKLRWRAPQPNRPWAGIAPAHNFRDDCMQIPFPGDYAPLAAPVSENCLYLNLWRPAGAKKGQGLPVIVWIHGGGFVNGGTSTPLFDGGSFAKRGVIMVSINYRLGRFGFFGFPELTRENADHGLLGNFGYMDQIAALKWIKRNIAEFGGNPNAVTIFGESAGAISVNALVSSPLAHGLFRGAIMQSGGARENVMGRRRLKEDVPGWRSLDGLGVSFAEKHGIKGTGKLALDQLRALSSDQIVDGLNIASLDDGSSDPAALSYGGPAIDGLLVTDAPGKVYAAGKQAKIPVIAGASDADLGFVAASNKDELFRIFGPYADAARRAYDPDGKKDLEPLGMAIGSDRVMVEPARFVVRAIAAQGLPSYAYRFSYVADSAKSESSAGALHATDVPYTMNTVALKYGKEATAKDVAVGEIMNRYWVNFAKTGNPNGPGLPDWPRYNSRDDRIVDFAGDGVVRALADPWKQRLDLAEKSIGLPDAVPATAQMPRCGSVAIAECLRSAPKP